jgi:hypothetical protein
MKIPEPIIDPTTIMLASIKPRPRTSFGEELPVGWLIGSERGSLVVRGSNLKDD